MTNALVFFATQWGYRDGGINAFNIDLCNAVAELIDYDVRVVCVVPATGLPLAESAHSRSVHVLKLGTEAQPGQHLGAPSISELKTVLAPYNVGWWIGHDVLTGRWAEDARAAFGGSGGLAVVHHMDYSAYKPLIESDHAKRIDDQINVLRSADVIFAVGRKLLSSAKDKASGDDTIEIKEITPGLPHVEPLRDPPLQFQALTVGRFDVRNDLIKQLPLTTTSFAVALKQREDLFGADPTLTVLGISEAELCTHHDELLAVAEKAAGKAVPVQARVYEQDRSKLLDIMRRHSVMMMLSRHEGFGLVAWEAIGASIPLIISKNSGVYETIDALFHGQGTGCLEAVEIRGSAKKPFFREEDRVAVSNALYRIASDQHRAKDNAVRLRAMIQNLCTWHNAAAEFCSALKVGTKETAEKLNVSRWNPTFLNEAVAFPDTVVNAATKTEFQFRVVRDGMGTGRLKRFVMLFGGISSALSDDAAYSSYVSWLAQNPEAELFICYEVGRAALARAGSLDMNTLTEASSEARERDAVAHMLAKAEHVGRFCEKLAGAFSHVGRRFWPVPVDEPLTAYVMIADDELYVTPLMHQRSSVTLSFELAKRPNQFSLDALQYVIYNLERLTRTEGVERAVGYLSFLIRMHYSQE